MTDQRTGDAGARWRGTGGGASATGTGTPGTGTPPRGVPQQYEPRLAGGGEYGAEPGQQPGQEVVRADSLLAAAARQAWPAVLLGGLGMIALGICLLVWPHASLTVVAILIGAAILVSGLVRLWEGVTASNRGGGMRTAYVVIGIVAVLAGLYCLRHQALSLFLLTFLISVYFIVHGVADLGVAVSAPVPGRGIRAVLGVCSLAAGLILLIWPAITLVLLLTIAGAWLIFYGLVLGGLAFSLWRAGRELTRRSTSSRLAAGAS